MPPDRNQNEALYKIFDKFVLGDQRNYYEQTVAKHRAASRQVNRIRAFAALVAGLASALAGLMVLVSSNSSGGVCTTAFTFLTCESSRTLVTVLIIIGVIAPAVGGAFNILSDLYQWDRLIGIYESSLENLEVADSRSPDPEMDDVAYLASLHAYTQGTLKVMYDEATQWGQLTRTPPTLEKFIADEVAKADKASGGAASQAMSSGDTARPAVSPSVVVTVTPSAGSTTSVQGAGNQTGQSTSAQSTDNAATQAAGNQTVQAADNADAQPHADASDQQPVAYG